MPLWSNTDANTGQPKFATDLVKVQHDASNLSLIYANTTSDAFITGAKKGIFGVSPAEKIGTGNLSSVVVKTAGDSAYDVPVITITGANSSQATVTVNVKTVNVSIYAGGTGYANGNTLTAFGGTATAQTVITVTDINSGTGAVQGVSITTPGVYSVVPTANINTFVANTALGSGFRANLRFGIATVTTNAAGIGYNRGTIGATAAGSAYANGAFEFVLTGEEGTDKRPLAGWNLRTEGSGGRAGRVHYECLVGMGSMTTDGPDNAQLANT